MKIAQTILSFMLRWWPTAITVAIVLYLTLAPDPTPDVEIPSFLGEYADKIIHAIMMGGITGAMIFDWFRGRDGDERRMTTGYTATTVIIVALFSIIDEWAQSAMGLGRTGDVYDLLADFTGIFIALLVAPPLCRRILRGK